MPDLDFRITGVEACELGITPLLQFKLMITNPAGIETTRSLALHTQIQIQCPQRPYTAKERERLADLFGTPERWGETLRNRLWAHVDTNVPAFLESIETRLTVPCTYDLNVASAKYFYALESGEISLLFLFSGTLFYDGPAGSLQAQRISWEKETVYRMPLQAWRDLMDYHYPASAWLYLDRAVFERLSDYRRRGGFTNWEETIQQLLPASESVLKTARKEVEA